jgi:hypothetical protein
VTEPPPVAPESGHVRSLDGSWTRPKPEESSLRCAHAKARRSRLPLDEHRRTPFDGSRRSPTGSVGTLRQRAPVMEVRLASRRSRTRSARFFGLEQRVLESASDARRRDHSKISQCVTTSSCSIRNRSSSG